MREIKKKKQFKDQRWLLSKYNKNALTVTDCVKWSLTSMLGLSAAPPILIRRTVSVSWGLWVWNSKSSFLNASRNKANKKKKKMLECELLLISFFLVVENYSFWHRLAEEHNIFLKKWAEPWSNVRLLLQQQRLLFARDQGHSPHCNIAH